MLNRIRYFQSVVRNNSFTEAAEENHISQSAISQQVRSLEAELGVQLLTRKNRKFELTEAGTYFYSKSLILTADYDRMVLETVRIYEERSAEFRIGYPQNYGSMQIQNALSEFSRKYPDIRTEIISGSHEELYGLLRSDKVDIVLNDQRRAFSDEYENYSLGHKLLYAEISARNPMSMLTEVSASELKNTPCILTAGPSRQKREGEYYREILGIESEILYAGNTDEAKIMTVQNNGYMPVPEGTPEYGNTTKRIPLIRNSRQLSVHYCAFRKTENRNAHVSEFARILKKSF